MFLLTSVSVTSSPAVIPLSGTSQAVSEKWSRKGAVHNCFWSFNRSRVNCPGTNFFGAD